MTTARNAGDFLQRMAAASRHRVAETRTRCSEAELRSRIAGLAAPSAPQFTREAFHLIAEVKRRSPSAGRLAAEALSPVAQARRYAEGGALVISVLTEPDEFAGDIAHIGEIVSALPAMPVMRKDFLVDIYQVLEARAAGAAGVLLIAALLDPHELRQMMSTALELGMFVLVEVFDRPDLQRCSSTVRDAAATAQGAGRLLLGVNCRDLRTLAVDTKRFAELAPHLPRELPWVAESGIETPAQAAEAAALGYSLALVGSALMRSSDPALAVQDLLRAGRRAAPARAGAR